jgi:hypothetical protein
MLYLKIYLTYYNYKFFMTFEICSIQYTVKLNQNRNSELLFIYKSLNILYRDIVHRIEPFSSYILNKQQSKYVVSTIIESHPNVV